MTKEEFSALYPNILITVILEEKYKHSADIRFFERNCLDEEEFIIEGSLKWDGCSNWNFKSQDCWFHCCTREELEKYTHILQLGYDMAKECLGDIFFEKCLPMQ